MNENSWLFRPDSQACRTGGPTSPASRQIDVMTASSRTMRLVPRGEGR